MTAGLDLFLPTLSDCEQVIERGLTTFVEVGQALATIRDGRLYKDGHATFEDYCRDRWGFNDSRARQLIAASEVAKEIGTVTNVTVTNEGQARALGQVTKQHGPEAAAEVLEEVAATGAVTAARITDTARQRNPITPEMAAAADAVMGEPLDGDDFPAPTELQPAPKPHVANNSGNNEWYTPPDLIRAAADMFFDDFCPEGLDHESDDTGCTCPPITTDPASSELAQRTVQAKYYYTADTDGLAQEWRGHVWLNPPYSQPLLTRFIDKLLAELDAGRVRQALVLVNNATETQWAQRLIGAASAVCFLKGRVRYLDAAGQPVGTPLQGQMVVHLPGLPYLEWWDDTYGSRGGVSCRFADHFEGLGQVMVQ